MKTPNAALILLCSLAAQARAGNIESLTLACPVKQLPSQQDVGRLLDLHNFSQVYAARVRVMHVAQRGCQGGADQVRIVNERVGDTHALGIAAN